MPANLVLIVEDNQKNLELVQDILEFRGFRTLTARCGQDGISMARTFHPDVILMDVQLPDFDGIEALGRLRVDSSTAEIPVVALTAFAMSGDGRRLLASGFDGYLAKPIDVRTLADVVLSHCQPPGAPPSWPW